MSTKRSVKSSMDLAEGADIVMVKPAMPYLDVIAQVKARVRKADGCISGQRRVRDAQGRRAQRLAR